jgi:hypothetical protein
MLLHCRRRRDAKSAAKQREHAKQAAAVMHPQQDKVSKMTARPCAVTGDVVWFIVKSTTGTTVSLATETSVCTW